MSNATFGQYANNLAKQRVLDQQNHDRAVLVATIVGLTLAIAIIFGWIGMSRQNAGGDVTVNHGLFQKQSAVNDVPTGSVQADRADTISHWRRRS